jgi:hypothetical protein
MCREEQLIQVQMPELVVEAVVLQTVLQMVLQAFRMVAQVVETLLEREAVAESIPPVKGYLL